VFARFAAAARPRHFAAADSLGPPLRYLKACAHAAVVDARREARRAASRARPLDDAEGLAAPGADPVAAVVDRLAAAELWRVVLTATRDEAERAFADLAFRRGLPPREVQQRRPDLFPTVTDAYRVGRNLLDRLRRNPNLRRHLDGRAARAATSPRRRGRADAIGQPRPPR
jgi:hypothetical protein